MAQDSKGVAYRAQIQAQRTGGGREGGMHTHVKHNFLQHKMNPEPDRPKTYTFAQGVVMGLLQGKLPVEVNPTSCTGILPSLLLTVTKFTVSAAFNHIS